MRGLWLGFAGAWILVLTGCGGGNNIVTGLSPTPTPAPTPSPTPAPTTFTVSFEHGTPTAAAVQMGSGTFAPTSIQNGQTSFTLPSGTTSYALAFVCPPW